MWNADVVSLEWNVTDVVWYVVLQTPALEPASGIAAAQVTAQLIPDGAAPIALPLSGLASPTAAWSAGGWIDVPAAGAGVYRVDLPNTVGQLRTPAVTLVLTGATIIPHVTRIVLVPSTQLTAATTPGCTATRLNTAGLPSLTAGKLVRRELLLLDGPAAGERVLIVDQTAANVLSVAPPLTTAPNAGNQFVIR